MKQTWATINDIMNKNSKDTSYREYFSVNNLKITNAKEIAQRFNEFFINIGPSLASSIIIPQNKSYTDFLNNPCAKL